MFESGHLRNGGAVLPVRHLGGAVCPYCHNEFTKTRPDQVTCGRDQCQYERMYELRKARIARRKSLNARRAA